MNARVMMGLLALTLVGAPIGGWGGLAGHSPPPGAPRLAVQVSSSSCLASGSEASSARCPAPGSLWWEFSDALCLQFVVGGNCCPDSNRFVVDSWLQADTIVVSVADTAASICRCTCNYVLSVSYPNLRGRSYVVRNDTDPQYLASMDSLRTRLGLKVGRVGPPDFLPTHVQHGGRYQGEERPN